MNGEFLLCGLDGLDIFEGDNFGGVFVDSALFVGQQEVRGQDEPSTRLLIGRYSLQVLRNRDYFLRLPSRWIDCNYF